MDSKNFLKGLVCLVSFLFFLNNQPTEADWSIETVDSNGDVGRYTSLALDSSGNPHISYYDYTNADLKHAYYNGGWSFSIVDSNGDVGQYTSLALNSSDNPHISYYDYTNADLKYAYYNGGWHTSTVDSSGNVGMYSSFALRSTDDLPFFSYYDATNGNLKLLTIMWNPIVDSSGDVGMYSSLALDSNHNPHISYYDATNSNLKYSYWDETWHTQVWDSSGTVGGHTSIALRSSDDLPMISYYDATNGDLKFATIMYNPTVDSVGNVGKYNSLAVDSNRDIHISYYDDTNNDLKYAYYDQSEGTWHVEAVDSNGNVGRDTSIAIDSNNYPHISYYDGTNGDLKYAYWCKIEYGIDYLEPGNPGGWSESLKTFEDELTIPYGGSTVYWVDIWINDVPEDLVTAGFYLTYDPSLVSVEDVIVYNGTVLSGPWDSSLSFIEPEPDGPGTHKIFVGNFASVSPDVDGDIIIAEVGIVYMSEYEGSSDITISTIPGFDTIVADSSTIYDSCTPPNIFTIHLPPCECTSLEPSYVELLSDVGIFFTPQWKGGCGPQPLEVWQYVEDCIQGDIDEFGFFTTSPKIVVVEACNVCAIHIENTDVECCADVWLMPDVGPCDSDGECEDGIYCNGSARCVSASCELGEDPCDDENICTLDFCDESINQCLPKTCDESILSDSGHPCCSDPPCIETSVCNYCAGDFDCDEDCDGTDAAVFKADFGRGGYNNPCSNNNPCDGDFDCDTDVDGTDAAVFKADFGRGGYNNPCPSCEVGEWCVYP